MTKEQLKTKRIIRIEAKNKNDGKVYHWDRHTIGNIINNIPKLIRLNNVFDNIKIYKI